MKKILPYGTSPQWLDRSKHLIQKVFLALPCAPSANIPNCYRNAAPKGGALQRASILMQPQTIVKIS